MRQSVSARFQKNNISEANKAQLESQEEASQKAQEIVDNLKVCCHVMHSL